MKCKNCGAEVSSELSKCPYCECEIEKPKPSSINTTNTTNTTTNIVNNYYTNNTNSTKTKKKRGIFFWIIAVLFWPISLSIWFYKTDKIKLEKKIRIIIIAVLWIILLIIGAVSPDNESASSESNNASTTVTEQSEIIEIDNTSLGEYGIEKTLNANTEDAYKFIEYHIPEGKYKVTNKGEYPHQITVYSDEYVLNDSGWEEAKESFDVAVVKVNESAEISIGKNQHIKFADGKINFILEKIG